MRTFISFREAREIVLEAASKTETEKIAFERAVGRTLAGTIEAVEFIPPFDNSAMDGYAVRFEDTQSTPVKLSVAANIPAGTTFDGELKSGQSARIMTGAPVPRGSDAIVPVEMTRPEDPDHVFIDVSPREHAHIRRKGADVRPGDTVFRAGDVITPAGIGMLATLGQTVIDVHQRPRVAIISTGDEIVSPGTTPGPGQIRNSNGPALAAQTVFAGGEAAFVLHARDEPRDIQRVIEEAQGVDLFVFSGGVSMGEYDYVRTELDRIGAVWEFWKVKQRPGKPLAFGTLHGRPIIGLPGNPVSSSICFEIYVRPLIAMMSGQTNVLKTLEPAILLSDTPKVESLYTFARGILGVSEDNKAITVTNTGNQASNLYSSVVNADCIIHLPDGLAEAAAGTTVMVERLAW